MSLRLNADESRKLWEFASHGLSSKLPVFACAYDIGVNGEDAGRIPFACMERPQLVLLLTNSILGELGRGRRPEETWMMEMITSSRVLLAGVGLKSAYSGADTIYALDELGMKILRGGYRINGSLPIWAKTNYDFMGIPMEEFDSPEFDSRNKFKGLLSRQGFSLSSFQ